MMRSGNQHRPWQLRLSDCSRSRPLLSRRQQRQPPPPPLLQAVMGLVLPLMTASGYCQQLLVRLARDPVYPHVPLPARVVPLQVYALQHP